MTIATPQKQAPKRDVQVAEVGENTLVLRSRSWERLKFEIEYARQRGTTANSYLIQAKEVALLDPPGESFSDIFLEELQELQYYQRLYHIILSHVNPNRLVTLTRLLEVATYAQLICSKPAAKILQESLPEAYQDKILTVRDGDTLDLGNGHELRFAFLPTPRWPDMLATYDPASQICFTDKLYGAHVCGEAVFDEHWRDFAEDRRYYFNSIHAAQAVQVESAIDEIAQFPAKIYAPAHGPLVRNSLSRLKLDYHQWCEEQQSLDVTVAVLYTSAYGNTAAVGQAIAKGITDAGAGVETINCEYSSAEAIRQVIERCDGFIIGSPTLAGHAPTQIQTALGVVISTADKTKLGGAFGSFGWSGEAVDMLESKIQDAGYQLGMETIRVKFTPTPEVLSQCEAVGEQFVLAVQRAKRQAVAPRQMAVEGKSDRTSQAVGRVTGAFCVLTAQLNAEKKLGLLTSWVSQAAFSPPAITVSVPKEGFPETLEEPGASFVINILGQSSNSLQRHFQKAPQPGIERFAGIEYDLASNGHPYLKEALAYLECQVKARMECGDHWLLYAMTPAGTVLESSGVTALNHRKSGDQY
jgi:flavorubredoxin/flavin reductase (DIM6/NTAB) family NADH-FMN oxidoreductase RutF